jgi:thioredoxin 1
MDGTGAAARRVCHEPNGLMSESLHPLIDVVFEANVLQAGGPVLVDFWEPRCRACRSIRPDLERLHDHLPDPVRVFSLDVNSYPDLAHTCEVDMVPTLLVFRDGHVTARLRGARKIGVFVERVTQEVALPRAA